jgi:hypothetical protein
VDNSFIKGDMGGMLYGRGRMPLATHFAGTLGMVKRSLGCSTPLSSFHEMPGVESSVFIVSTDSSSDIFDAASARLSSAKLCEMLFEDREHGGGRWRWSWWWWCVHDVKVSRWRIGV